MKTHIPWFARAAFIAVAAAPVASLAQWWNPAHAALTEKLRPPVEYDKRLEQQALQVVFEAVTRGDHAKLDGMHDEFVDMHRADGPGLRLVYQIRPGLKMAFNDPSMRKRVETLFEDWRQASPESRLRPVAEANYHESLAWRARGSGYASTVSDEGWKTFRSEMERAVRILDEGRATAGESPLWYESALSVGGASGASARALDKVLDEGAAKFPSYGPLYATRLHYLLPQWGGEYRTIDRFIRAVVMRTQARWGTTLYSDLYTQVLQSYSGDDFFRETSASWPILRHAFEEQVARGAADLNRYATFACVARDRETTARLLSQLGDKANLGHDIEGFSSEACVEMVREAR